MLITYLLAISWMARCQAYDYASACARPYRSHRARHLPAPCDLSKNHYCTIPGNNYPWHAIRRFVRENQGLMRRMYGEERHISILKAELDNYIEDTDDVDDFLKTKNKYGRAAKVKPHFRPIQTDKKVDNDTLKVKPLPIVNKTQPNTTDNETAEDGLSYKTKLESIANIEFNNIEPEVITLDSVIKQSIESNTIYNTISAKSDLDNLKNASLDLAIEIIERNSTEGTTEESLETTTDDRENWKPINADTSTLPPTLLFSEHDKVKNVEPTNDKKEEFHPKPHHQESMRPAVVKLGGRNACETKEEMTAPFWANSTRGEVLALLNMYPFEQYIHLETCVHEKKQMYCREGCRCEQQYRLHRLLAYDPRNECRGIFADWFKFPACCVCKCYDVPLEFRARSPRILPPQYTDEVRRAIHEDVARDWYASYEEEGEF